MQNIAVIGLGIMGLPIASNLIAAGHAVTGFNRSSPAIEELEARGGQAAASIKDAVHGADIVITMLPDSPDVEEVLLGVGGVVELVSEGTLLIDMSSVSPETARLVAAAADKRGVRALDAPVSGGEQGAIEASLSIMVGGTSADFEAARSVLEAVGRTIVHVGGSGSGQIVKAANQLIVAGTIQLVAEALTLLDAHDVELDAAVAVLAGGLAGNRILDRKAAGMIAHEFAPGFRAELHHKDLGIVVAAARELAAGPTVGVGGRGVGGAVVAGLAVHEEDLSTAEEITASLADVVRQQLAL